MRIDHFEALQPVCPVCRSAARGDFGLTIAQVAEEAAGHILQAILHCSNRECQREYPVIDGVPILIPNIRQFISDQPLRLLLRGDLSPDLESLVGDCLGPGSDYDHVRQQVSAYTWEHYGEFDEVAEGEASRRGTMLAALEAGLELAGPLPAGPVLDLGCGCGRGAFALAERTDEPVLGIDLHFPMLQVATQALRNGVVRYGLRRGGVVYDRREFSVPFGSRPNVDFWACDAAALPFADGSFAMAVGLNLLDSVYSPRQFLESVATVLGPGGKAVLACPYDWSPAATPPEAWLGGHSQRSAQRGSSAAALRLLLTAPPGDGPLSNMRLTAEQDDLPWSVRLHDRATMEYRLHLAVAERASGPPV